MAISDSKHAVRERVWSDLEQSRAARGTAHGHIPDFYGAEAAASRAAGLRRWRTAKRILVTPDTAQQPSREIALRDGKLLYIAVPRLERENPFFVLDPATLTEAPNVLAATPLDRLDTPTVETDDMQPVDLVLCGSVAVNRAGVRTGKGAGFFDLELALLYEAGLIGLHTLIITTVHSRQVLAEPLPEEPHDGHVRMIVTPEQVIACPGVWQPTRINWDELTDERIQRMPALRRRRPR